MRKTLFAIASIGFLFTLLTTAQVSAQADEATIEATAKAIDKDTANKGQSAKVDALARQFRLSPIEIQDLRAKKQGWGEVTIQLAMAQHLSQSNPTTYPTIQSALAKVEALRAEKMGYGNIAKELGFKLGPVVSDAKHVRNELVRDLRGERPQKAEKMERAERADRPTRPERPERPVRPEKPERPGR
jgi:multidrug efflux pump subunit AcrA (membrane-fusion protein)